MIDKQKVFITYIMIGYFINLCSSQSTSKPRVVEQCSRWNISTRKVIFGQANGTAGNDDYSLNLSNSGLGINTETGEIAVLDDKNHRVLVFNQSIISNQSNGSTIFAILSNSSNLTNNSMIDFSPSAITYDSSNSIYILDDYTKQVMKMKNPLEYGENATLFTTPTIYSVNQPVYSTLVGLCVDNTDGSIFISDCDQNEIITGQENTSIYSTYVGSVLPGSASNLLNYPTSIVMDNNQTLFVNDFKNNRIQMFKFKSQYGITLPTNIAGCIGLSLYLPDILVMTTKNAVHLFNWTNNETTCALGCDGLELNDTHNALIDNDGNLIVTDSNQVVSYSIYEKCPDVTMGPTTTTTASTVFNPINNCAAGKFGINCSSSDSICDVAQPCLNNGSCIENNTVKNGYTCDCAWGFNGSNCENDQRPCKPYTCFQRGNCTNEPDGTFNCTCLHGYEGNQCEMKVNFCGNITCQNRGVCFQEFLNYTCNCLVGYSGRHCEITATSTIVHAYVSRSFGYIAILMLSILVGFFVIMDVLKYVFGIDPVQNDRDMLKYKRMKTYQKKKAAGPTVAYRFQYVN